MVGGTEWRCLLGSSRKSATVTHTQFIARFPVGPRPTSSRADVTLEKDKMKIKLYLVVAFVLAAPKFVWALDIQVKDYLHIQDIGLFFVRQITDTDVVHYVPRTQTLLRNSEVTQKINGETYNIWLATVVFPDKVNLDEVRRQKPEWAQWGFVRSDVEAQEHCRVAVPPVADDFHYFQKINPEWQREGLVSSTEAIYCQVNIAIKVGDTQSEDKLQELRYARDLIATGIAPFKLIYEQDSVLDLEPPLSFLHNYPTLAAESERSAALVLLGASFTSWTDSDFATVMDFIKKEGADVVLDLLFDRTGSLFTPKTELSDRYLNIGGQTIEIVL